MNIRYLILTSALLISQHAMAAKQDAEKALDDVSENNYEQKLGECMKKANLQGVTDDKLDSYLEACVAAPSGEKDEG